LGPKDKKGGLMKKLWHSKAVQAVVTDSRCQWIFDGEALAWSKFIPPRQSTRTVAVDLDVEGGGQTKGRVHNILITPTKQLDMNELTAYLRGGTPWSVRLLELMSKNISINHIGN
jgi:hypothetical protein